MSRRRALLFGESQSRIVVTCRKAAAAKLLELAARRGVPAKAVGSVGGKDIAIACPDRKGLRVPVEKAFRVWKDSLPAFFKITA